ncbi:hypothetical protein C8D99_105140 [Aminivibrio pyruvatiphilus]|uniref:Uncharacterized protein n=1 Tax=Aminivibrio pyruvatiphilus TaxID=1005740 RepID=A0A4R8MC16_9BACT|nr:hypothetical protein C8D99_105140 [Aminivibrio pyruvatiphilus]
MADQSGRVSLASMFSRCCFMVDFLRYLTSSSKGKPGFVNA